MSVSGFKFGGPAKIELSVPSRKLQSTLLRDAKAFSLTVRTEDRLGFSGLDGLLSVDMRLAVVNFEDLGSVPCSRT